jgi:phage tail sheath protein FI
VLVPPSGHVAGIYARTDATRGVHKAPANEVIEGVLRLERNITNADQDYLNPKRVNCLRSFPGRGIRVWGARTLGLYDAWTYVNVRRVFLTAVRWINWHMGAVVFEPNDAKLWARIERDLNTYFIEQYRKGALKGRSPQESFYVKCNAETNPPELRESGQVITEIGLAPANPYEFVVVRLIHGASGVSISGPIRPEQNL